MFLEKILIYGKMIKFSHSVFALPFALSSVVLATRVYGLKLLDIIWIIIAMIAARSAAMGFNRIIDAQIDLKNPRTQNREIPTNKISVSQAKIFVIISSSLFILSSFMLANICFYLSFLVLWILFFYSYTKRVSHWCHIYLGFAISLAPIGAWIAISKNFSLQSLVISLALLAYIAGFDIIYACQDLDFDKQNNLFSVPVKFGLKKALFIAFILQACSVAFFIAIFFIFNLTNAYLISVLIIGFLFILEYKFIKIDNAGKLAINSTFFNINSSIPIVFLIGIVF